MLGRGRALLTIIASALAMPVAAQAPAPTGFDGIYAGVSREVSKNPSAHRTNCPKSGVPGPLTITKGVVRWSGGEGWEGTVSPEGGLMMRAPNGGRFDGQIDGQGTIRGQIGGWGCKGHIRLAQTIRLSRRCYPPSRRSMKATAASSPP